MSLDQGTVAGVGPINQFPEMKVDRGEASNGLHATTRGGAEGACYPQKIYRAVALVKQIESIIDTGLQANRM